MIRDMGKVMDQHRKIQTENSPGRYTPQRNCAGPCRKRKSVPQFEGANTTCKQCVRQTPKTNKRDQEQ